jgi:hypothetical protein
LLEKQSRGASRGLGRAESAAPSDSSNWGTPNNGILGRGQYVEILKKASRNGQGKLSPERKKCTHMMAAIVVEGANVGRVVDVCADPACETHHGESRKAREAQERTRTENRKQ